MCLGDGGPISQCAPKCLAAHTPAHRLGCCAPPHVVLCLCLQEQADSMKMQLEAQQKAVDQLIANTR